MIDVYKYVYKMYIQIIYYAYTICMFRCAYRSYIDIYCVYSSETYAEGNILQYPKRKLYNNNSNIYNNKYITQNNNNHNK